MERNPYFDANEAFRLCDFNASGHVSKDEIRYMMSTRGHFMTDNEAREVADKMD